MPVPPRRTPPVASPSSAGKAATPLQAHLSRWAHGCGGLCCKAARHVCLVRGTVPCDLLFVGEAPGASEDVIGRPFVGPAGQLLDEICRRALGDISLCLTCHRRGRFSVVSLEINEEGQETIACPAEHLNPPTAPPRLAFTNVVGCLPREETGEVLAGGRPTVVKAVEPATEDVMRCAPRVTELVEIARPHLIVAVGRIADEWLDQGARFSIPLPKGRGDKPIPQVKIDHPASILRANITMRNLMVQRVVAALRGGVEDLSSGEL